MPGMSPEPRHVTTPRQVTPITAKPSYRGSLVKIPVCEPLLIRLCTFVHAAMYGKRVRGKVQNDQVFVGWKH